MLLASRYGTISSVAGGLPPRWLAGGYQDIFYSDDADASTWTSAAQPLSGNVYTMASNGTDLIVAAGETGQLATSPDGLTWTSRTSSFSTSIIWGVAYGNGYWVAVGAAGKLATSTDGITWTQRTSGTANTIYSIAYGNGTWAFVDSSGGISSTTDPTSGWTSRTSTLTSSSRNNLYYDPNVGIWIAGADSGTSGALASSTDATTWTSRDSAINIQYTVQCMISNSSVIAMAVTTNFASIYDVQTSTNGTTWTNRTFANYATRGAAVDTNDFMIMAGARVQSSTDGVTWTDETGALAEQFQSVCHTAGLPSIR